MKQYSFILSDRTFEIKDENDLELIFKLFSTSKLSSIIHWNIIMEVDNDLEKIVTSYRWLLKCLKYLNEKNTFLLLVKMWDVLTKIITKSTQAWNILSKIPEESSKIRLLKTMRLKWLLNILKDAGDLWNIIQWLYWDTQREFLDYLWNDIIKQIFLSTNEIIIILYYLTDENKDYLMDIIWFDWVKNKVKTKDNLLVMFKWLSIKKAKVFLSKFSKQEIVNMFHSEEEFYKFMLKVPLNKEKIFLKYLWL